MVDGVEHGNALPTVLVVDDDCRCLRVVAEMVQAAGYRVLTASDASQALVAFEKVDFDVDLVLSDVKMPGMSGPELVRCLRSRKPNLSVVLMSGFTDGLTVDAPLLEKPFGITALHGALSQALSGLA